MADIPSQRRWQRNVAWDAETMEAIADDVRAVVLVEGVSDRAALEALATQRGYDFASEGVGIVAIGGATNLARYLALYGPEGRGLLLAGLCDAGEVRIFRRTSRVPGSATT